MPERIASDHPSVETIRGRVQRHGGSRRVAIPGDLIPSNSPFRVVIDEDMHHAVANQQAPADTDWITGVYPSPQLAREQATEHDILTPWLETHAIDPGSSVEVDIIVPAYALGLRVPGSRTVYPAIEPPSSSLSDIARSLEDGG